MNKSTVFGTVLAWFALTAVFLAAYGIPKWNVWRRELSSIAQFKEADELPCLDSSPHCIDLLTEAAIALLL